MRIYGMISLNMILPNVTLTTEFFFYIKFANGRIAADDLYLSSGLLIAQWFSRCFNGAVEVQLPKLQPLP